MPEDRHDETSLSCLRFTAKSYICRIPGPGTELLINRKQEKAVYDAIKDYGITEHVVYTNGETGYKIPEYYEGRAKRSARLG